ncbi:MAG TPA: hypothetical protein VMY37_27585, partial [Thermoguttaceae bacterium]|nr:hypothetical protein [Thermoguttaceae bacterium]
VSKPASRRVQPKRQGLTSRPAPGPFLLAHDPRRRPPVRAPCLSRALTANASGNASLKRWAARSRTFIADPEAFDRACWLDGGWALDDDVWREA